MKGKWRTGAGAIITSVGAQIMLSAGAVKGIPLILVPFIFAPLICAFRLALPNSYWAKRFYDLFKMERARTRYNQGWQAQAK
jgi:hypothetical protein